MAQITFDLSGTKGLTEKFQGDLNDTTASPNRRYIGGNGQFADGIFNPLRKFGYLSPATNVFASLTGSTNAPIIASAYDSINDVAYFAEAGAVIWKLDGLDDTSLTADTTVAQDGTEVLKDVIVYEINGTRCLLYAYNLTGSTTLQSSIIGVKGLDSDSGIYWLLHAPTSFSSNTNLFGILDGSDSSKNVILTQSYDPASSVTFDKVMVRVARLDTDNGGYTIRVSIQDDNGSDQPDGNVDASGTIDPSTIIQAPTNVMSDARFEGQDVMVTLNTSVTKTGKFWIVMEATVAANVGATDGFYWGTAVSGISLGTGRRKSGAGTWNTLPSSEDYIVSLVQTSNQIWSTSGIFSDLDAIGGPIIMDTDADIFFRTADNGLLYVFEDHKVHSVNGTPTGGGTGTITESIIRFPSYFKCVDAVDTRGRMYVAIQSNPISGYSDARTYSESVCGVYVWDRQSNVFSTRDFIPLYGVRDIKKIYVEPSGDVRVICIGDDRFTQIRSITSGYGKLIQTLGLQAYPEKREGLKIVNNMVVWLGADGVFYMHGSVAPGEAEQIFKLGSMAGQATGAFTSGILFVGHEESTQSRQKIIYTFTDTADDKIQSWYPHGVGTISSVAQTGNQGDVYTLVKFLPELSTVNSISIYMLPTSSAGATQIATIKPYFNQSSSAWASKALTLNEATTGLMYIPVGKPYVNSVQLEIEFSTSQTLGNNDFHPIMAVVDYTPTSAIQR